MNEQDLRFAQRINSRVLPHLSIIEYTIQGLLKELHIKFMEIRSQAMYMDPNYLKVEAWHIESNFMVRITEYLNSIGYSANLVIEDVNVPGEFIGNFTIDLNPSIKDYRIIYSNNRASISITIFDKVLYLNKDLEITNGQDFNMSDNMLMFQKWKADELSMFRMMI